MGIAGFYLWLQRWYGDCVEDVPEEVVKAALDGQPLPASSDNTQRFDNFYLDMNGLIHPCCHDTAPLPEPESEEEMFERIFAQVDLLYKIVRPRKCLVLCIDGVAPQSKMNQQRSRRFRAAEERIESEVFSAQCAEDVVKKGLPLPQTRSRWDHNVITPSTPFMERVGLAIEWFIMKKINEDPAWRHIAVIFSDAHVPGEGEHKIMHYIRELRAQLGYNPQTSHVIHGMDADLICLGLSTHEEHVTILRNQLTETFQPDHNRFCYFSLYKYRLRLREDFGGIGQMDFERVLDDFIFLCFFVGNDFLPHVPLISIKTKGIELLLDHYVRGFKDHSYLTHGGEVNYGNLAKFLRFFLVGYMEKLKQEYGGVLRAKQRAKAKVEERVKELERELEEQLNSLQKDRKNAQQVSNAAHKLLLSIMRERARLVVDKEPLGFSYVNDDHRDKYYEKKFGWDPADREAFEKKIQLCCAEYLRGTQWVMRYYTTGCPSWDWYYPFYYAPLLQDLAHFPGKVKVKMTLGAPRHPVLQLLAVLPRLSVEALPEELHDAVKDPESVLGVFYPEKVDVDFSEAHFSYQGVLRLPFVNNSHLQSACQKLVRLEPDFGFTLLLCHESSRLSRALESLLADKDGEKVMKPIPKVLAAKVPIGGKVGPHEMEWPRHARLHCPDDGIASETSYGAPIKSNAACCYRYELNTQSLYRPILLRELRKTMRGAAAPASTADNLVENPAVRKSSAPADSLRSSEKKLIRRAKHGREEPQEQNTEVEVVVNKKDTSTAKRRRVENTVKEPTVKAEPPKKAVKRKSKTRRNN
ncbi:putative exoribonuclease 2 [Trypanosoma cruzi]|nr:putative exoribonuclease 2 [Trypanosoma cruzi]